MPKSVQKKSLKIYGNYRGLVLDNIDPDTLGRIKVQVYPHFKDITVAEQLPWAVPAMPISSGAGLGFGTLAIPAINSFVWVFYEAGNPYQPVYFAEAQTAQCGIPAVALAFDYPHTKTITTPNGIVLMLNDKDGKEEILVYHPTGTLLDINKDGQVAIAAVEQIGIANTKGKILIQCAADNVEIYAKKDATITADGNITVLAATNISATVTTGNIEVTAAVGNIAATAIKGNVAVTAAKGNVAVTAAKGNVSVTAATGNITVAANGNASVTAEGNLFATADGNATVAANGNATVSATGILTLEGSVVNIN